jgi:hypothetical protein
MTFGTHTLTSTSPDTNDAHAFTLSYADGSPIWADKFGGPTGAGVTDVAVNGATGRLLFAGGFQGLAKFGNKEANSLGATDGYVACIIPVQ